MCGDHKQTPGGLRKSDEARAFRRKLMRRPIALKGRHQVHTTTYAGRHSPSVCARCAWTPSGRIEAAPSGKHQATTGIIHWECCCVKNCVKKPLNWRVLGCWHYSKENFFKMNSKGQNLSQMAKTLDLQPMQKLVILAEISSKRHSGSKFGCKTSH